MLQKSLIFSLIVRDYDEALDFYTKRLGFVVAEDAYLGEERWLTISAPGNQDCVIALHEAEEESDRALIGRQGGSFPLLGVSTEDCLGDYQLLKALGVQFHGEPEVRPYGTGVLLEDLYGNKIYLSQEPET